MTTNPETSGYSPSQIKSKALLRGWLHGRGYLQALKAMDYAQSIHTDLRKDGSATFTHQVFIAQQIRCVSSMLLYPEETLIVAFLHDVIEDYPDISLSDIESRFGDNVASDVALISKVIPSSGTSTTTDKYHQLAAQNPRVSVAKGYDRYHNLSTMRGAFSAEKIQKYLDETRDYVDPMLKAATINYPEQENIYRSIRLNLSLLSELYADLIMHGYGNQTCNPSK